MQSRLRRRLKSRLPSVVYGQVKKSWLLILLLFFYPAARNQALVFTSTRMASSTVWRRLKMARKLQRGFRLACVS